MERRNSLTARLLHRRILVIPRFRHAIALATLCLILGSAAGLCDEPQVPGLKLLEPFASRGWASPVAASLVDRAPGDLIFLESTPQPYDHYAYFLSFYSGFRRSFSASDSRLEPRSLGERYKPVLISRKLRERELATHHYAKSHASTTEWVADIYDGDCVVNAPFIYPAQENLARAVIIMVENAFPDKSGDGVVPQPPTVLVKLGLKRIHGTKERYMFTIADVRELDRYYCLEDELIPLIERFAAH